MYLTELLGDIRVLLLAEQQEDRLDTHLGLPDLRLQVPEGAELFRASEDDLI